MRIEAACLKIPSVGVMYDCIQLEAGPVTGDGSYKLAPATVSMR